MSRADDRHAFLLFSGTNDRAVYAMARVICALGERLAIVARSSSDRILFGSFRDKVISVRGSEELSTEIFREQVAAARRRVGAAAFTVVPVSEYFNTFILDHRKEIEETAGRRLPLVNRTLYAQVTNKATSAALFAKAGIRVPAEFSFATASIPYVAKPNANIIGGVSLYPVIIESEAQDKAFRRDPMAQHYFLQEFVAGRSFYLLCYVASNGDRFVSSQENFAQQPNGKSILLAATSDFHHTDAASKFMDALVRTGFTGLAMAEFIVDEYGACFIELNPRLWGPFSLCADHRCGIIEAFIGDALHGEPHAYSAHVARLPMAAKYLWLGGAIQSLRQEGYFDHRTLGKLAVGMKMLGSLTSDVYLRRDSWRVFLRETCA
jgi:hypothetical protein